MALLGSEARQLALEPLALLPLPLVLNACCMSQMPGSYCKEGEKNEIDMAASSNLEINTPTTDQVPAQKAPVNRQNFPDI